MTEGVESNDGKESRKGANVLIELPTRMAGYVVDKEQRDLLRKSVHQKEFERIEVIRLGHFLEAEQLRHLPNDLRILAVEVERDPVEPVELRFLKKPFAAAAVCFENLFKSAESRSRILFLGQGDDSFECVRPKTSPEPPGDFRARGNPPEKRTNRARPRRFPCS